MRDESTHGGQVRQSYKIAMVAACPFPCPRGTPLRIQRMAEALAKRGHEIHVIAYHLGDAIESVDFALHRIPNVPTYSRTAPGPTLQKLLVLDPLLVFKLRQILKRNEVDLIVGHHIEGLLAALAARGRWRRPVVFELHAHLESELPYYQIGLPKSFKRRIGRVLDRRLPGRATGIIVLANDARDELVRSGVESERIAVIPGAVELDLFAQASAVGTGVGTEVETLIYSGTLAEYQGIEIMLEAFAKVQAARSHARLVIASDSSFRRYESLVRRLGIEGQIDHVGADIANLPGHLARADIALSPQTDRGGYSQKVLNYMAAGKPIVSFSQSDQILVHGETAWLVERRDATAFAQGALHLLRKPELATRLGANARRRVAADRSWDKAAEQAERFFHRLLQESAGSSQ